MLIATGCSHHTVMMVSPLLLSLFLTPQKTSVGHLLNQHQFHLKVCMAQLGYSTGVRVKLVATHSRIVRVFKGILTKRNRTWTEGETKKRFSRIHFFPLISRRTGKKFVFPRFTTSSAYLSRFPFQLVYQLDAPPKRVLNPYFLETPVCCFGCYPGCSVVVIGDDPQPRPSPAAAVFEKRCKKRPQRTLRLVQTGTTVAGR